MKALFLAAVLLIGGAGVASADFLLCTGNCAAQGTKMLLRCHKQVSSCSVGAQGATPSQCKMSTSTGSQLQGQFSGSCTCSKKLDLSFSKFTCS